MIEMAGKEKMAPRQNYVKQKHAKELERTESRLVAALVSEQFPKVSGISIRIIYHGNPSNPVLMVRTVNFFSSSHAFFHMQCIKKDCDNGGFDLTREITKVIRNKKKSAKGKMVCGGVSLTSCQAPISYEISVKYHKCSQ